jgi:multidrug efflux system membrane fusion protein
VPNENEELWPGQFLAARIVLRIEQNAMVLPEGAVQPGQDGPFVFVASEGRARIKDVVVDRQIGEQVVLAKGLDGDERVIIDVPPTLAANSPIVVAGEGAKGAKGKGKGKGKRKEKSKDNGESAPAGAPSDAGELTKDAARTEEKQ